MGKQHKLIANLKKAIGEEKWLVLSGTATIAAVTAATVLPSAFAAVKDGYNA